MRIALIGVSGSGKSAQAKLLAGKYRISHISTGDLLREESRCERLSEEDRLALEEGQLVSDDVVRALLEERLRRRDTKRGFVIDGYPRNIPQAQSLDNLLGMLGRPLQIAIFTEMDAVHLVKRNVGRQTCTGCGEIYNKYFSPPAKADVCDKCGAPLGVRRKDTPKAVASRVSEHKEKTVSLITYFRAQHKLRTVAANGSVEDIHDKVCAIVDLEVRPLEIGAIFSAADSSGEEDSTVIAGGQINRVVAQKRPKAASGPGPRKPSPKRPAARQSGGSTGAAGGKGTGRPATATAAGRKPAVRSGVKAATKKASPKAAGAGGTAAKKAAPAKATVKKAVAGKAAAKKAPARKTTTRKSVARKITTGKTSARKAASGQPAPRKVAAKKKPAGKTPPGKPTAARAAAGAGKGAAKGAAPGTTKAAVKKTGKAPAGKATGRRR